ncbi:hypothetical protein N2152v2_000489 [Parachlorella kessleri]
MSQASAGVLPLRPLLPKEAEQCRLIPRVLTIFLTLDQRMGQALPRVLRQQLELVYWLLPRALPIVRGGLPCLESLPSSPFDSMGMTECEALLRAGYEAGRTAAGSRLLLRCLSGACKWDYGTPRAVQAAKELIDMHCEAMKALADVGNLLGSAEGREELLELWLEDLAQLAGLLRAAAACSAAHSAAPGAGAAATSMVLGLIWDELHHAGHHVHTEMFCLRSSSTWSVGPAEAQAGRARVKQAAGTAARSLKALIGSLGLCGLEAGQQGPAAAKLSGWYFTHDQDVEFMVCLTELLSGPLGPLVAEVPPPATKPMKLTASQKELARRLALEEAAAQAPAAAVA